MRAVTGVAADRRRRPGEVRARLRRRRAQPRPGRRGRRRARAPRASPRTRSTPSRERSLRWIAERATELDLPVQIHLSETEDEVEGCARRARRAPGVLLDRARHARPAHGARPRLLARPLRARADRRARRDRGHQPGREPEARGRPRVPVRRGPRGGIARRARHRRARLEQLARPARRRRRRSRCCRRTRRATPRRCPPRRRCESPTGRRSAARRRAGSPSGAPADFLLVRTDAPELALGALDAGLVYAASGAIVDTTVVAGRVLMRGGVVEGVDEVVARRASAPQRLGLVEHGLEPAAPERRALRVRRALAARRRRRASSTSAAATAPPPACSPPRAMRRSASTPQAPDEPGFRRGRLEDLDAARRLRRGGRGPLAAPRRTTSRERSTRSRTRSTPARGWCLRVRDRGGRRRGAPVVRGAGPRRRPPSPESAPEVIPLAELRIALEARFRLLEEMPTAYHARRVRRPSSSRPSARRSPRVGSCRPARGSPTSGRERRRHSVSTERNRVRGGYQGGSAGKSRNRKGEAEGDGVPLTARQDQTNSVGRGRAARLARSRAPPRVPGDGHGRPHARLPVRLRRHSPPVTLALPGSPERDSAALVASPWRRSRSPRVDRRVRPPAVVVPGRRTLDRHGPGGGGDRLRRARVVGAVRDVPGMGVIAAGGLPLAVGDGRPWRDRGRRVLARARGSRPVVGPGRPPAGDGGRDRGGRRVRDGGPRGAGADGRLRARGRGEDRSADGAREPAGRCATSSRRELARAERTRRPLALVVLDLDHFKRYNDAFGHPAGDDALQRRGEDPREITRSIEVAARIGGEEFAIVAPDADEAGGGARRAAADRGDVRVLGRRPGVDS